jgi:putative ABC transport system substrate-binding protein
MGSWSPVLSRRWSSSCALPGLIVLLTLGMFCSPGISDAQRSPRVPRLGVLGLDSTIAPQAQAGFRAELRALGYVDGQTIIIEYRWAEGRLDRLPALAAELVALPVNVLVTTHGMLTVRAAQKATTTIPIVSMIMNDPVKAGCYQPGAARGNLTSRRFKTRSQYQAAEPPEAVPRLTSRSSGMLPGAGPRSCARAEDAAQALGLRLYPGGARAADSTVGRCRQGVGASGAPARVSVLRPARQDSRPTSPRISCRRCARLGCWSSRGVSWPMGRTSRR